MSKIFNPFKKEVKKILADYKKMRHRQTKYGSNSYLTDMDTRFYLAINELMKDIQNPTLNIVIVGTTSSGKSTLANLLCGAEIVPAAVQEMSAGVVVIEYSKQKSLHIHPTPNALWNCREWHNITDDKIHSKIADVMKAYLRAKNDGISNVKPPEITLSYPFHLVKNRKLLQLPRDLRFRIIDLPGMAFVGDSENLALYTKCKESLCLVAYNSAETDRKKTNILLQEVVEQVKKIGDLRTQILFVFNRIDVFRHDRDWPQSENKFVTRTIQDIEKQLNAALSVGNQRFTVNEKKAIKIAALPGLLSLLVQHKNKQYSADASLRLDRNFSFLLPDELIENLPRNPNSWTESQRKMMAQAVWKASYAEDFFQQLKEHIQSNLASLILLPAIKKFENSLYSDVTQYKSVYPSHVQHEEVNAYFVKGCSKRLYISFDLIVRRLKRRAVQTKISRMWDDWFHYPSISSFISNLLNLNR